MKIYSILILIFLMLMSCSGSDSTPTGGGTPIGGGSGNPPTTTQYSEAELLVLAEKDPLKYFWDYAESNSKLARERYNTDNPSLDANIVTTGGSGFGLMTILVGIKNGYVSRSEAVSRLTTSLQFLENADRFHGAWPHWIDGSTGKVIPFGNLDNGGDLVETAFLVQGLICVREFFKDSTDPTEKALVTKADALWKGVEWDWYRQGNQNALYWHWSPSNQWAINLKIQGYNECLMTYVLAAASPTHSIPKVVFDQGYESGGSIKNGAVQYGIPVVANHAGASGNVGPMFFSHYSFLGLDPNGLSDANLNYQDVTTNHAKIMYQYCLANPKGYVGYSAKSWGLTASYSRNADGSTGYSAHSPLNDLGIISPTAALSSFPYTPTESMAMLKFLYNDNYDKYIGVAGPYDAYSLQYNWVTPRYLAIDQGPIAPMVENYKTGFIWSLFMNAPEVKQGLIKLGFHSTKYNF
ncbi:hypothetical protein SAMN05421847_2791 [Halpernia humi]|uniref:Glycoamylase-like domain-containing protein n=1 Tax=Halpernia humi TaxID=493375 RepID=A0A1H6B7Z5_9FLAO|nr:glucoamylase family protein [Halpernia humi]SEG56973.1 hypothetical protein SAMN05421847_2791 [Halpernia humi]